MIISLGQEHRDGKVSTREMSWPQFVKSCSKTKRTSESYDEYLSSKKKTQSRIKASNGYFIGGESIDGSRKRDSIMDRSLLTLDIDHGVEDMEDLVKEVYGDYEYCIYSTHKHCNEKPRLRLVFPLSENILADDYESFARQVALDMGMDYFDDTTYQHTRIMFWPTTAKDGDWLFIHNKGEFIEPDEFGPFDEFPKSSRELDRPSRRGVKQVEDPRMKNGIIGAFCREYSIPEAIDEFLSDIYEETTTSDRYTFVGGSTSGGAIVYDEETILFSQHESDPAHGNSVNSYDLVRIHLIGEDSTLDDMNAWISQQATHVITSLSADDFDDDEDFDEEDFDEDGGAKAKKVKGVEEFKRMTKLISETIDAEQLYADVLTQLSYSMVSKLDLERLKNAFIEKSKELSDPIGKRDLDNGIKELQALRTTGDADGLVIDEEYRIQLNRNVFVSGEEKIFDVRNNHAVSMRVFNTLHKSKLQVGDPLAELVNEEIVKTVHGRACRPGQKIFYKQDGLTMLNTYKPVRLEPRSGDVTPLLEHMEYLLQHQNEQDIVLDFIAYMIQFPGLKVRWMPIIKGGKGIGKSLIGDYLLSQLLGDTNVIPVNAKTVYGDDKDGGWKIAGQIVVFHEMDCGRNRKGFTEELKSFITDRKVSVRMMRENSKPHENLTNAMGFTNAENSLIITEDERRFCMMESYAVARDEEYYSKLVKWLESHIPELIYFFKHRDLSEFTPNQLPYTEYTQEIKSESRNWITVLVEEALIESIWPFNNEVAVYNDVLNYLEVRKPDSAERWEMKQVSGLLKECGLNPYRPPGRTKKTVRVNGSQVALWMMPFCNIATVYELDPDGIVELLQKNPNPNEEDFAD